MPEAVSGVSVETVVQIVESIFTSMLDVEVFVVDRAGAVSASQRYTSSVYLEGDWNGAVSFECGPNEACILAGRFLSSPPPPAVDDDVRDVLGELANMIGGNIKSAIGADIRLSVPSVIEGRDYEIRVCGSDRADKISFEFSTGTFSVTVIGTGGTDGVHAIGVCACALGGISH